MCVYVRVHFSVNGSREMEHWLEWIVKSDQVLFLGMEDIT